MTPTTRAISIASAAPFSALSLPAKTARSPPVGDQRIDLVGICGGRIASTETTSLQPVAWNADTHATVGGGSRPAARRSASATAASTGRWSVCTTGAHAVGASATAGASKA
jgi:hypothetical protein